MLVSGSRRWGCGGSGSSSSSSSHRPHSKRCTSSSRHHRQKQTLTRAAPQTDGGSSRASSSTTFAGATTAEDVQQSSSSSAAPATLPPPDSTSAPLPSNLDASADAADAGSSDKADGGGSDGSSSSSGGEYDWLDTWPRAFKRDTDATAKRTAAAAARRAAKHAPPPPPPPPQAAAAAAAGKKAYSSNARASLEVWQDVGDSWDEASTSQSPSIAPAPAKKQAPRASTSPADWVNFDGRGAAEKGDVAGGARPVVAEQQSQFVADMFADAAQFKEWSFLNSAFGSDDEDDGVAPVVAPDLLAPFPKKKRGKAPSDVSVVSQPPGRTRQQPSKGPSAHPTGPSKGFDDGSSGVAGLIEGDVEYEAELEWEAIQRAVASTRSNAAPSQTPSGRRGSSDKVQSAEGGGSFGSRSSGGPGPDRSWDGADDEQDPGGGGGGIFSEPVLSDSEWYLGGSSSSGGSGGSGGADNASRSNREYLSGSGPFSKDPVRRVRRSSAKTLDFLSDNGEYLPADNSVDDQWFVQPLQSERALQQEQQGKLQLLSQLRPGVDLGVRAAGSESESRDEQESVQWTNAWGSGPVSSSSIASRVSSSSVVDAGGDGSSSENVAQGISRPTNTERETQKSSSSSKAVASVFPIKPAHRSWQAPSVTNQRGNGGIDDLEDDESEWASPTQPPPWSESDWDPKPKPTRAAAATKGSKSPPKSVSSSNSSSGSKASSPDPKDDKLDYEFVVGWEEFGGKKQERIAAAAARKQALQQQKLEAKPAKVTFPTPIAALSKSRAPPSLTDKREQRELLLRKEMSVSAAVPRMGHRAGYCVPACTIGAPQDSGSGASGSQRADSGLRYGTEGVKDDIPSLSPTNTPLPIPNRHTHPPAI
ncbi:MAG: hypothetical protein WDW38_002577 [Sanguina aurantia]